MERVKCVISGIDCEGDSNFHFVIIEHNYEDDSDLRTEIENDFENEYGWDKAVAFFEDDENARCIDFDSFEWDTASVVTMEI